ncbi:glycoside hydrolase family 71 protein [Sclerotinia borealis F-4128]|uniref:Glycoside hydrolase family 71 protein n=1 Tax=Sclerotinia borealis (strain F-4128) TaxID=1432307 RepID=W9CME0_SCLBF|nr:glycoside hydrolase family 71 protein [Sclerotinia borealis F-4128]
MRFSLLLLASTLTASVVSAQKYVFAHVVMGNTAHHTADNWATDIKTAQAAGIDAFALNIATGDTNIPTQVANAFKAATTLGNSFKLFFSFDYLGGSGAWPATGASSVVSYLNQYGVSPAYFKYNGQIFVSTFEGVNNAGDWIPGGAIRSAVQGTAGSIYFVPDYTSLGPAGFTAQLNNVQGAFSWDMWPAGPVNMTTTNDLAWQKTLGSKAYMMGVSPWFFHSDANPIAWMWRGDDLWAERWQQVLHVQPQFVEIVTWNDWGESSYIGPLLSHDEVPANSLKYVQNMPHSNLLTLLPYYISQYKGTKSNTTTDSMQYWYRTSPASAGTIGGVLGNNPTHGQKEYSPNTLCQDKVFFTALLRSAADVQVQIGSSPVTSYTGAAGLNHWSQPFNGQTGNVTFSIVRSGNTVKSEIGTAITAKSSVLGGFTNYNSWVGGF